MGIKVSAPAYRRRGEEAIPEYRGKLQPWGEVGLSIIEDDVELIEITVEDENEGRSTNRVKPTELLEALSVIMERLEQANKKT